MGGCCSKESGATGPRRGPRGSFKKFVDKVRRLSEVEHSELHRIHDRAEFDVHLTYAKDTLLVVDFHAIWCGACHKVKPDLEKMAARLKKEHVVFLKIDVDEVEDVADEFEIKSLPTFVLIRNRAKVDEVKGAHIEQLKQLIETHKKNMATPSKRDAAAETGSITSKGSKRKVQSA